MGYRFDPWVRYTPKAGRPEEVWLFGAFTDARGPVWCRPDYRPDTVRRVDVNRRVSRLERGIRCVVDFRFEIAAIADQTNFAKLMSRLGRPDLWKVELSLDGGIVWREIKRSSVDGPDPLAGKPFVGARYQTQVECVDLLPDYPDMNADAPGTFREMLRDTSLEDWTSATNLRYWTTEGIPTNGSLNQDSSQLVTGNYSARLDRSVAGAGNAVDFYVPTLSGWVPNKWYRVTGWHRANTSITDGVEFVIVRTSPSLLYWRHSNPGWWATHGGSAEWLDTSTDWKKETLHFQFDQSFGLTDVMSVRCVHRGPLTSDQIFYDDVSCIGPVRKPGINGW